MTLYFLYAFSYLWHFIVSNYRWGGVFIPVLFFWVAHFALKDLSFGEDIKYYYYIFVHPEGYYLDELGLYYFNLLLREVSTDYLWFSFSYALLVNTLLMLLYKKLDKRYTILLFLYVCSTFIFYQINLNIFRQGVSVILVLLSVVLFNRRLFLSVSLLSLAIFIHKAAILGVCFLLLSRFEFKKLFVIPVVFLCLFPVGPDLYYKLFALVGEYIPIMERTLSAYADWARRGVVGGSDFDHRNLPIIFTALMLLRVDMPKDKAANGILWVYIVSLGLSSFLMDNVLVYDRVLIFSQILQPYVFLICCKAYFNSHWLIPFVLVSFSQFVFTVSIWGPQNLLPQFDFYPVW